MSSLWKTAAITAAILGVGIFLVSLLPTVPEMIAEAQERCADHGKVRSLDTTDEVVVCKDGSIFHVG